MRNPQHRNPGFGDRLAPSQHLLCFKEFTAINKGNHLQPGIFGHLLHLPAIFSNAVEAIQPPFDAAGANSSNQLDNFQIAEVFPKGIGID